MDNHIITENYNPNHINDYLMCRCCKRHQTNRVVLPSNPAKTQKGYDCKCYCRMYIRLYLTQMLVF